MQPTETTTPAALPPPKGLNIDIHTFAASLPTQGQAESMVMFDLTFAGWFSPCCVHDGAAYWGEMFGIPGKDSLSWPHGI